MTHLIRYFAKKHLVVNLITIMVMLGGVFAWNTTNKEELPDITFNVVRISTLYSGASAADVEFYVTRPIEEALGGIDGIKRISSSSGSGSSSVRVELDRDIDIDKAKTDIQNQVNSVDLPDDVLDDPNIRVFETSKKAIIDIALYNTNQNLLTIQGRQELQQIANALENRLLSQNEIFEARRTGYLKEEVVIQTDPKKFEFFEIPLTTIANEIRRNHVRAPAGTLKSGKNEQVTLLSELDSKAKLDSLVVQGGFDSKPVKLSAIATITDGFEDTPTIYKVNGREMIMFEIVKNSQYGILDSLDVVRKTVSSFQKSALKNTDVTLTYLDDESIDIRNRLSIITSNGLLGFCLILVMLFIFLNKRSAFWVAMGIPITLCFTMIAAKFLGFTINGITLAGVIIVLGIVVDDAIIVAENISRKLNEGQSLEDAAVTGTEDVIAPVVASVLTTCAAFIPLYFFTGRYGLFVAFIPPMIFLMLLASIIESFFLLPSHMTLFPGKSDQAPVKKWFTKWEAIYESFLKKALPFRHAILGAFVLLLIGTGILVQQKFSFVMFPRSESREIVLSGIAARASTPEQTSEEIQAIEDFLSGYIGKEGIGTRTRIALGRRGDAAVENQFQITLEILPKDKRNRSSQDIVDEIKAFTDTQEHIEKLRIRRSRFGQTSGSAFEILVQENDDSQRDQLISDLRKALENHPDVSDIEADFIPTKKEYSLNYNQAELKRLSVNPSSVAQTLRTILNGSRLYTLFRNDDEIDVTLTVKDNLRTSIETALEIPVENVQGYLVPLEDVIAVTPIQAKKTIRRYDEKRTSFLYADIAKNSDRSPLDVAEELENTIFQDILSNYPNAQLKFDGEIVDTRESRQDLINGILFSIALIYLVLALLFDSITKPLRILLVVPFGIIGVILAFYVHGKTQFGFYAAIGALGMLGVVVNDAIVMLNKFDKKENTTTDDPISFTAKVATTRLRAILLTTLTTVAGVMPTAYGFGGTDTMLSDMMIAMAWGLLFGSSITLLLIPCVYLAEQDFRRTFSKVLKPNLSLWILFCILVLSPPTLSQTTLSINDFLNKASQHDTTFHSLLAQQAQLIYDQDRFVTSPELSLQLESSLGVNTPDKSSTLTLSQTIPKWGQTVSVSGSESESSGVESAATSFTVSQDIAKNAFGKQVALSSTLQHHKTDLRRFQLTEAYEDYFSELTKLYYTWIRQYESLKLAQSSYKENKKVLNSIKSRKRKKIADQTDVNKLQLQTITKEENIIRFKASFNDTTQKIKRAIAAKDGTTLLPNTTVKLDPLDTLDSALNTFQTHSRTMAILDLLKKEDITALQLSARDLLPSLSLSSTITRDDETSGFIGASLSLPLFKSQAKATYETLKKEAEQTNANITTTHTTVIAQLTALHNTLSSQKILIRLATQKRKLAYSILQEESENYSYGKINLNDYIVAVNQYDQARFDEIDRKITYQQLITEWKRLTDQLVATL